MSAGAHLNAALAAEAEAYRELLRGDDARPALLAARDAYLASHAESGTASWGRLVGALKMALLAGDGADPIAHRALVEVGDADTPASAYLRALAQVTLGERPDVAALGDGDGPAYAAALDEIVADFAARDQHLSGVAIADTALVLERLAEPRGIAVRPGGPLVPAIETGPTGDILRPDLGL